MSLSQVSIAVGCATRDRTVAFASTFATFFTRAFDQIRMAAISDSNINLCGSHCGVSIGKDTHSSQQQPPSAQGWWVPASQMDPALEEQQGGCSSGRRKSYLQIRFLLCLERMRNISSCRRLVFPLWPDENRIFPYKLFYCTSKDWYKGIGLNLRSLGSISSLQLTSEERIVMCLLYLCFPVSQMRK